MTGPGAIAGSRSFVVLVADALRESRRKKLFWVVLWISVSTAVALVPFQFRESGLHVFGRQVSDRYELPALLTGGRRLVLRHTEMAGVVLASLQMVVLGWGGLILCISATAGFLPDFLRAGRVDLTLARPVGRWQILLAKYAGGVLFVAIQAGVFVALTCLVVSLNSGHFYAAYLLVWPLIVYEFACLFAVSMLIGLLSRSTVFAILGTLGFSAFCYGVNNFRAHGPQLGFPEWVRRVIEAVYFALPKIQDVGLIAQQTTWAAVEGVELTSDLAPLDPAASVASSLILPAVVLAVAIWRFRKMDC